MIYNKRSLRFGRYRAMHLAVMLLTQNRLWHLMARSLHFLQLVLSLIPTLPYGNLLYGQTSEVHRERLSYFLNGFLQIAMNKQKFHKAVWVMAVREYHANLI